MNDTEPTPPADWQAELAIENDDDANAYLRKRFLLEQEHHLIYSQAKQAATRINSELLRLDGLYASSFENYTRKRLEESRSKKKSVIYAYGTAGFRTVPARLVVTDNYVAFVAAHRLDSKRFTLLSLNERELLDYVNETGELVEGVTREPERQSFAIQKNKAGKGDPNESETD